jgi:putative molybdopterin biosynthesis protein
MSVYLHDIPLPEAKARLKQALQDAGLWRVLATASIPLDENALGRVTAEPIWAKISSPHYHASAMDGFAVRAVATNGALPSKPITLQIGPEAQYVDTGDPLPDWANAVILLRMSSRDELGKITTEIRNPSIRIGFYCAVESCPSIG